jgi:hypothetical protein
MQISKTESIQELNIKDSKDIKEIRQAINAVLYVPDPRVKPIIITYLTDYLRGKFSEPNYLIKAFIAYCGEEIQGFIMCQIHPTYRSYGKRCGSFGWLHAKSLEVSKHLIEKCELFILEQIRKQKLGQYSREEKIYNILRGPINFPKNIGGLGFQINGFDQQLISGVAFSRADNKIFKFLEKLGYQYESEYTCLQVVKESWKKGKKLDNNIEIKFFTIDELEELRGQVYKLGSQSFYGISPDNSGFHEKYDEFLNNLRRLPSSHFKLREPFDPWKFSDIPEYHEAWNTCDIEKIISNWPCAFDRENGNLVGILLTSYDLFELEQDMYPTRINVDTAMVDKNYANRGIFSVLNNIGQITCRMRGITYFEGTYIWTNNAKGVNNEDAINSIFPHCTPIRKHIVVQKKLKNKI